MNAPPTLALAREGQRRVEALAATLSDADTAAPSALPGWTRGHVLTHLARNADALVNLLTWARTGVPTPMYASPAQRDADIETGASRTAEELRADVRDSAARFHATADALSAQQWAAPVRTRAGREIPASEVPWLRVREVWLHLVDLDAGARLADVPEDVAWPLVREVAEWMSGRVDTALDIVVPGHPGVVRLGSGAPRGEVRGTAASVAGWLTGRSRGEDLDCGGRPPSELPPWL